MHTNLHHQLKFCWGKYASIFNTKTVKKFSKFELRFIKIHDIFIFIAPAHTDFFPSFARKAKNLVGLANADLKISLYVCVHIKTIHEHFAFLILRILELFAHEVCKFLKISRLIFILFYCFWMFVNKLFIYLTSIEIALRHGCSPINLLHIFRTPFLKNTSGWLLLYLFQSSKLLKITENQTSQRSAKLFMNFVKIMFCQ